MTHSDESIMLTDGAKEADPYIVPTYSFANRSRRLVWGFCYAVLYRTSPRSMHAWRSFLLRVFGAQMGPNCHFYPSGEVWAPWNLTCEEAACLGDGAEIYNPSPVHMGRTRSFRSRPISVARLMTTIIRAFPLISFPSRLGAYFWVCARAVVMPGVNLGDVAVLGLASVATRYLEPWSVYAGTPARKVKMRPRHGQDIGPRDKVETDKVKCD